MSRRTERTRNEFKRKVLEGLDHCKSGGTPADGQRAVVCLLLFLRELGHIDVVEAFGAAHAACLPAEVAAEFKGETSVGRVTNRP